jgi:hypothetical protein
VPAPPSARWLDIGANKPAWWLTRLRFETPYALKSRFIGEMRLF